MALTKVTSEMVTYDQGGTGSVERTLEGKLQDRVSVFDFLTTAEIANIQSNISTDAAKITTTLQAVLNGGGRIFFPAGTYVTEALFVKSNTIIEGDGAATIFYMPSHSGSGTPYVNYKIPMFRVDAAVSNVVIRDLQIDGNNTNQTGTTGGGSQDEWSHGVRVVDGSSNVKLENLVIHNMAGDGILIGYELNSSALTHNVVVSGCDLYDNERQQLAITHGHAIVIDNCYIGGTLDIELNSSNGKISGISITNCHGRIQSTSGATDYSDFFIYVYNPDVLNQHRLSGINIANNRLRAVSIQIAEDMTITGNRFVGGSSDQLFLIVLEASHRVTITGNTFISNTGVATSLVGCIDNNANSGLVICNNVWEDTDSLYMERYDQNKFSETAGSQLVTNNIATNGIYHSSTAHLRSYKALYKLEILNTGITHVPGDFVVTQLSGPYTNGIYFRDHSGFLRADSVGGASITYLNLLPYGRVGTGMNTGVTLFSDGIIMENFDNSNAGYSLFSFRFGTNPWTSDGNYSLTDTTESCTIFLEVWF